MKEDKIFKTREEFAPELNMCARTMSRKLKKVDYKVPERELLSPEVQEEIKLVLKVIPPVQ